MPTIRRDFFSGIFYVSLAKYSNILVQIVVTAILARLLTPSDYGIVAIATVFIAFFNILTDIGIGPAIIQFKNLNRKELEYIFSFTIYFGFFISVIFFLSSWPIAYYYDNEQLIPVCQCLSITIFFHCCNIVPQNLQYKQKKFRLIGFTSICVYLISATVAIILALFGFGVFSLIFQQIISIVLSFGIFYLHERLQFHFRIDMQPIKKIMSFSLYQFAFNIVNYFSRNLDKLLIGRYIGVAPLGQYEKSYRLMMMPLQNLTFVFTPIMQPIFSTMQNDFRTMADKYMKIFKMLCYIGFPLSVVFFFCGRELVLIFFGHQWEEAVLPFRILAISLGLQLLNGTSGAIYQSANATKQLFISGCWCAFFMLSSFFISIIGWKSINAVAIGYVIAQILNSGQTYYLLFKTLNYPLRKVLPTMIYPIIISLVIGIVLYFFHYLCCGLELIYSLSIKSFIAFILWVICIKYWGPYKGLQLRDIYRYVKNK